MSSPRMRFCPSPLVGEGGEIEHGEIEPGEGLQRIKDQPLTRLRFALAPSPTGDYPEVDENTKKPLRDWFLVTHFMLSSKKGMSVLQIQRMMGFGSCETAHSMCHKIRVSMITPEEKLGGIVEVDETYVGGKAANVRDCDSRVLRRGHWYPSQLETNDASEPEWKQLELLFAENCA